MNADSSDNLPLTRRRFLELTGGLGAGALLASAGTAFAADQAGDRKIRMGIVGGGFGATFQWREHPNCVVTGVTDLPQSGEKSFAGRISAMRFTILSRS